jgi:D-amino-acid dehydrogenase
LKLAVIGAGVIGTTTAFELVEDGHEVTVFEPRQAAAEGASFATGGLLAPEWSAARSSVDWNSKTFAQRETWWSRWRRPPRATSTDPAPALRAMALLSQERFSQLTQRLQLPTETRQGLMAVWRHKKGQAIAEVLQRQLSADQCRFQPLSAEQARKLETALSPDTPLHGALVVHDAETANCRQFTLGLKAHAQRAGCRFEFGVAVRDIRSAPGQPGVMLAFHPPDRGSEQFDAVVLCAGSASADLLKASGLALPLERRVAHALSGPVKELLDAPVATVHDLETGITIARSGQRVRAWGPTLRLEDASRAEHAFKPLYAALGDWFPGAIRSAHTGTIQEWSAHVACTPDALPFLGATAVAGLWLNTAHGMHGWLLACGCARALADQIAGRPTPEAANAFAAQRFGP